MALRRALATTLLLCLIAGGLASCVVRRRIITRTGGKTTQNLQVADKAALIDIISRQYNRIRTLSATVDMTPALGTAEKNHITEYKDVRGYIRFRKPALIRIIGLYPVVRNKAFDMVSNGADFKLYIPAQNRFIEGQNQIIKPSSNKIENLRPQHFVDALLVRPIDPADDTMLENFTDEDNAFYILYEVHDAGNKHLDLVRGIWFDRTNLQLAREMIFDSAGNILTDARYSQWKPYDNVPFPSHIEIDRPRDEYAIVLNVVKLDINKNISDDEFVLNQPEGSTLKVIGEPPTSQKDNLSKP